MFEDQYSKRVIGLAMNVHRTFGPGLLESAYEEFLSIELTDAGIPFARQTPVVGTHSGHSVDIAYSADILVGDDLIFELKSVDQLAKIHEAQILTYLRLSNRRIGLLFNFNTVLLRDGLRRFINSAAG